MVGIIISVYVKYFIVVLPSRNSFLSFHRIYNYITFKIKCKYSIIFMDHVDLKKPSHSYN